MTPFIPTTPLHSAAEGILWPAIPSRVGAEVTAQLYQLGRSQWWPDEVVRPRQMEQLSLLVDYAFTQSDFYRDRFLAAGLAPKTPITEAAFRALPLLTRTELLTQAESIHCRASPKAHGGVEVVQTSGSTGQVVAVKRTGLCQLIWLALGMRTHLWHQSDFRRTMAVIRANVSARDDDATASKMGWGSPVTLLHPTGPCYALPLATDVAAQAEWILRRNPGYLLTYPTNLAGLLGRFEEIGQTPAALSEVRTIGETVSPDLRARCRAILGAAMVDSYSSQEVGAIALECPSGGLYHVHTESLIVEVLDPEGRACSPGEVGRVVVTDLHNFATPLIRYELRDYAEVGLPCPCGRGLPTLRRITGRERNMVRLPSGERYWPLVGMTHYREVGGILQYQLIQETLEGMEMRLVTTGGPLTAAREAQLTGIVQKAMRHPFHVRFTYFEGELPRGAGGKFEDFVCRVGDS